MRELSSGPPPLKIGRRANEIDNFEYGRIYTMRPHCRIRLNRNDRLGVNHCDGLVDLQECGEAFADFVEQLDWSHASLFDVSFLPGDAAHLIH